MAAPTKYPRSEMLSAAAEILAEAGVRGLSMSEIGRRVGAPSGSLYHRFEGLDDVLASLWIESAEEFQSQFLAALGSGSSAQEAAVAAAAVVVGWTRANPDRATVLLRYRREDLLFPDWPPQLSQRAEKLARQLDEGINAFVRRSARPRHAVVLAVIDIPYAAVRRYLGQGQEIPDGIESMVSIATTAVMQTRE